MILNSIILGCGSPVLILHGLFGEAKNWMTIAKSLSLDHEVHVIDQRNHGNSFHHSDHNYLILAFDIFNYIEDKKLEKVSIIGHSMGGKVAMQFAMKYPEKLNKLIIVDIAPKRYPYKEDNLNIFKGLNKVSINAKSRKQGIQIMMEYIDDIVIINFLLKSLSFSDDENAMFKFNVDALEKNICIILDQIPSPRLFAGLTYFIYGQKSHYINADDKKNIYNLFPECQILEIPNAGHWVHYDAKDYFLDTIKTILN